MDGRSVESAKISNKILIKVLNDRLEQVKLYCPQDFARKLIKVEKHG